ncbi:MAG: methyltransferase domain-containing protein [Candidatus Dojkabacteria bacterium]|nr:methyltransferase domain-containing protein [Candidatus Dojkabacteria bacterium]
MNKIADYDFFDYDYQKYWKEREYENESEKLVLGKIYANKSGKWFLDIGGSYGRLAPIYSPIYERPVIVDYSLNTLIKNQNILKDKYPSIELVAANAYKLPFKENTFDGALLIRVLHHIENPDKYLKELWKVMDKNSYYVQEFANKIHLKSSLKAILRLNFSFFTKEPYQQPTKGNFEGTKSGEEAMFYNYHPKYIKELLKENKFTPVKKYGCSYIRSSALKKILGQPLMIKIESILQVLFRRSNIPPSVIYESIIKKDIETNVEKGNCLEDILACPKCKGDLNIQNTVAICRKCKSKYQKKSGIWDFRIK